MHSLHSMHSLFQGPLKQTQYHHLPSGCQMGPHAPTGLNKSQQFKMHLNPVILFILI